MKQIFHIFTDITHIPKILFKSIWVRLLLVLIGTWLASASFSRWPELNEINLSDGITTEILGIIFILVVIDHYRGQEAKKQAELREKAAIEQQQQREAEALAEFKKSLVRQARSRNNNTALDAIDIIREEGWLGGAGSSENLLEGAILSNADWKRANLRGSSLKGSDLTHAKIVNADLRDADLSNTILKHAILTGTCLTGSQFHNTDFSFATLIVTDKDVLEQEDEICRFKIKEGQKEKSSEFDSGFPVKFDNATLHGKVIKSQDGKNIDLYLDFSGLSLSNASFQQAKFKYVKFIDASVDNCDFSQAEFCNVDFTGAKLSNSTFKGGVGVINGGPDSLIRFNGAIMDRVILRDCSIDNVSFASVQTFFNADCQYTNFTNVDFSGAVMTRMIVHGARFRAITMNAETTFFDDKKLGEHWLSCYPNPILSPTLDMKALKKAFTEKLEQVIKGAGIEEFNATIELPEYKLEPEEDDKYKPVAKGKNTTVLIKWLSPRRILPVISPTSSNIVDDQEDF